MLRNCCVSCWDVNVPCTPCTCAHAPCYATAAFLAGMLLFLALAHMLNATQLLRFLLGCYCSLHLHTCSMLRNCCVSCWDVNVPCTPCTCAHAQCYATAAFLAGMLTFLALLALAHMLHATQLLLAGMLTFLALARVHNATQLLRSCWDVTVPCTCTHAQCYATAAFLAGMLLFLALAHMLNATQLLRFLLGCYCSLHLHTCSMLRKCCVSCWDVNVPCTPCTCAHAPCYATAAFLAGMLTFLALLALAHMLHATQLLLAGMLAFLALAHVHNAMQLLRSCWDVTVRCTCTHAQCYATAAFLAGMLLFRLFLALAHMLNATQLLRFLLGC